MTDSRFGAENVGSNKYKTSGVHHSTGELLAQSLTVLYETIPGHFTPHSIHSLFNPTKNTQSTLWTVEKTSEGRNFINRALSGHQNGKLVVFANCSFTSRNSYTNASKRYKEYSDMIAQRRKEGKTPDDDDDDDIRRVEVPLRIKVPYPEQARAVDIEALPKVEKNGLELRIQRRKATPAVSKDVDVYDQCIYLFARANLQGAGVKEQFIQLAQLTDAVNEVNYDHFVDTSPNRFTLSPEDRVVWFHDDSFDVTQYLTFQIRLVRSTYGKLLVEAEVFNHNQIHIATILQENLVQGAKL